MSAYQPTGAPYEYAAYIPGTTVYAQINKIGGGAPPREYDGAWEYVLRGMGPDGPVLMSGTDLNSGLPITHARAARLAFAFYDGT